MKKIEKIMYIEDEADIIAIAEIALQDLGGFIVKSCRSGKEALQNAVEFKPDLFLIDVMMPEMDGPTTLTELRKIPQFADIPIIFMTAKAQSSEVNDYINLGAVGVITKPFDPLTLNETIYKILESKNG